MRTPPSIGFDYHVSPGVVVATILVAVLAIVAAWVSGLPQWLSMLACPCIAGWATFAVTRRMAPRLCSLTWRADGVAELLVRDRRRKPPAQVQGSIPYARVLGPLIVLTIRWPPRERETIWLLPDNLDAETRRRLRMRLQLRESAGLASGNADSG